jgi:hypothetical protein
VPLVSLGNNLSPEINYDGIEAILTGADKIHEFKEPVSADPETFYKAFGLFRHGRTHQPVEKLTPYQMDSWRLFLQHKRLLEIKSNKVGETTKWTMVDFQLALLPTGHPRSCMGFDQLLIAQTKDHAKEHLRTLRKMIVDGPTYSRYLINKPAEISENASIDIRDRAILKDEQSKTSVIYIHNPEEPTKPSRIIALGIENHGAILSWKNVKHIHMSDITAAETDIGPGVDSAMTRLANTDGSMVIETVPGVPAGKVFEMWKQYRDVEWKPGDFEVYEVTAEAAKESGVISADFLEGEKRRLGVMYPRYYQAMFMQGAGNIFPYDLLQKCIADYPLQLEGGGGGGGGGGACVLTVDPAYGGSSRFGVLGLEQRSDGNLYVTLAEQYERPDVTATVEKLASLSPPYPLVAVDSAKPEIWQALQQRGKNAMPVVFKKDLGEMTMVAAQAVRELKIRIHPSFTDLIYQLQAVTMNADGHPDKKKISFDLGDCFLMAVKHLAISDVRPFKFSRR